MAGYDARSACLCQKNHKKVRYSVPKKKKKNQGKLLESIQKVNPEHLRQELAPDPFSTKNQIRQPVKCNKSKNKLYKRNKKGRFVLTRCAHCLIGLLILFLLCDTSTLLPILFLSFLGKLVFKSLLARVDLCFEWFSFFFIFTCLRCLNIFCQSGEP